MLAHHGDLLYKRSPNARHLGLVARAKPTPTTPDANPNSIPVPSSPSSDPNQSGNSIPLVVPSILTTSDSPTPTPSTPTPSSPTPSASSASASASHSAAASTSDSPSPSSTSPTSPSSKADSSSATPTAPSTASTSLAVSPSTSVYTFTGTTQIDPGISPTPMSTVSPATTSSPSATGATHTGTIVGGVAGTLAAIAAVGLLLIWCMRRQRSKDIDDFDALAFKRQSTVLVDDPVEPSQSYNPRPPTMIQHHNASPALAAQVGYGGQNFYGSYGGYSQQPSYAPHEMTQSSNSPPQAYAAPSMGYPGYDPQQQVAAHPSYVGNTIYDTQQQQQLGRQPSNATYLTRHPSSAVGYGPATTSPGSLDPNAQYIDLNRSSVSPYQAAQYADISRQLGSNDPNSQVPQESLDLPDDPLPSPFDDPPESASVPVASQNAHVNHPTDVATHGPSRAQGNATGPHQRPPTVYGESDAYDGI